MKPAELVPLFEPEFELDLLLFFFASSAAFLAASICACIDLISLSIASLSFCNSAICCCNCCSSADNAETFASF